MSKYITTISTYNLPIDGNDLVQFSFLNVIVVTVRSTSKKTELELCIKIQEKIEVFDSINQSSCYSRAKLLVVLGILSFISGQDFSVYEVLSSSSSVVTYEDHTESIDVKCNFSGVDYTKELKAICTSICNETSSENMLLFSLFDRWRKAQHQLVESDGEGLFEDESLLSFFHVLELLVKEYGTKQKNEVKDKISLFLDDLMSSTFKYRGPALDEGVKKKTKVLKEVLNGDLVSVGSRINYMFEQQGLLDERVQYLLTELIEARNSIAHGRLVYRNEFIWPLPPFFMVHDNHLNLVETIRILTARSIACHYKLDLWNEAWQGVLSTLSPPLDVVKCFIKEKRYEDISIECFCKGSIDFVTPDSIFNAYIKGKIKLGDIESSLGHLIMNLKTVDEQIEGIGEPLYVLIVLAESKSVEIAKFCRDSIQQIYDSRTYAMSNIKDYLRFLEHYNIDVSWFREWIIRGMQHEL